MLSASFKTSENPASFLKSAKGSSEQPTVKALSITVPTTDPNATDVTTNFDGKIGDATKSYIVPVGKEYNGSISTENSGLGGKIFIEGHWTVPSDQKLIYFTLVVQKGGSITFANENTKIKSRGQIIVAEGGSVENGTFDLESDGNGPSDKAIINYGTLKSKTINIGQYWVLENHGDLTAADIFSSNNSNTKIENWKTLTVDRLTYTGSQNTLINHGDVTIKEYFKSENTSNITIRNEGSLTTKNFTLTNGSSSIVNNCTFVVTNELKLRGTTVEVGEESLLSASTIDVANSKFNLYSNAMVIANAANFKNEGTTYVSGLGAKRSLMKLSAIYHQGWGPFSAKGNLTIFYKTLKEDGQGNVITSPAEYVDSENAAPSIVPSTCNGNGNVVEPGVPLEPEIKPVVLGTYSYAFEDNWPLYGDYDMNDLVTDISLTREQTKDNKLAKLTINAKVRALGATKRLGAAIQLDGVPASNIKSVVHSKNSLVGNNTFLLNAAGVENNQTYAVIPLCDDVHQAFGIENKFFINTTPDDPRVSPIDISIVVEFNTPVNLLTNEDLNVFIVTAGYKSARTEVHLNGKIPTDRANRSLFTSGNLKSETQPYRSHENLVWGLCIPESFDYPNEWQKITNVYSQFKPWAESSGGTNIEWYKNKK